MKWMFMTGLALMACASLARADEGGFLIRDREAFLYKLDLSRPALADVKAALDRGDVDAAGKAYIAHFRGKPLDSPLLIDWAAVERDPGYDSSGVDGLLAGRLWDGYSVYDVPESGLDWHDCPLSCLTRFPIFRRTREAIHHTGEREYVRFTVEHLQQYMAAYPIEDFVGKTTREGWTNHTTVARPWYWAMICNRLKQMSETIALLRTSEYVTDDELLDLLQRMHEETAYLQPHIPWWVNRTHNGGCAMIRAMAQVAAVLDDFKAAATWRDACGEWLIHYIDQGFYPDGMCVELTTAYSASVSRQMQDLANALRDEQAVVAQREKLAAMITCLAALSDPTGRLPSFGDLYAKDLPQFVNLPLAEWAGLDWARPLASDAPGPKPPFVVWPDPRDEQWCGYYTMRSDWSTEANYMAIDAGPWGTTHRHGDRLSFVITANGERFIIDPSSTRYASNEPDAFISRQTSGFLHNTITIDGVDEFESDVIPRRTDKPLNNRWERGENYMLFVADYSFAPIKPVRWERRVLFVDGEYWLIQDVLTGDVDRAAIEQNFQFEKDVEIAIESNDVIATAPNGAKLVMAALSDDGLTPGVTIGDREPHTTYWPTGEPTKVLQSENGHDQMHGRGWTGRSTGRLMPAPAVTFAGDAELPLVITRLIVPGDDVPDVTRDGDAWTLPIEGGALRFVSTVDSCHVE